MRKATLRVRLLAAVTPMLGALVVAAQAAATYPGRNGLIAFDAQTGDHIQLYTVRPDGRDLRQITHMDGDSQAADWSRDGRHILFEFDSNDLDGST